MKLVKLRITNEKEWVEEGVDSKISYEEQFLELYKDLVDNLFKEKIPTSLFSECSSCSQCQFVFNGFDSNTDTYFFTFISTVG